MSKKNSQKQQQQRMFIKDKLWNETPEIGAEGLIATIENSEDLLSALKQNAQKNMKAFETNYSEES